MEKLQAVLSVCHGSSTVYSEMEQTENGSPGLSGACNGRKGEMRAPQRNAPPRIAKISRKLLYSKRMSHPSSVGRAADS